MANCPHCNKALPVKAKGALGKYTEDVKKAQAAIAVLTNCGYANLKEACLSEKERLLKAIANPALLYSIYRRSDKKTPVGYGMLSAPALEIAA